MTYAMRLMTEKTAAKLPPLYDAQDLTNESGLAHVQLGDQIYTLRITKAGKLILTK